MFQISVLYIYIDYTLYTTGEGYPSTMLFAFAFLPDKLKKYKHAFEMLNKFHCTLSMFLEGSLCLIMTVEHE